MKSNGRADEKSLNGFIHNKIAKLLFRTAPNNIFSKQSIEFRNTITLITQNGIVLLICILNQKP